MKKYKFALIGCGRTINAINTIENAELVAVPGIKEKKETYF